MKIFPRAFLVIYFAIQILFYSNAVFSDESVFEQVQPGISKFESKDYEGAFNEFFPLHKQGNVVATHMLAIMSYHGYFLEKNHKNAAGLFYTAAKLEDENNYMAGGYLESAYWLAHEYFLNEASEYYNPHEGHKILIALDLEGHVEGSFYLGAYNLSKLEGATDPNAVLDFAREAFENAKRLGKFEASFMLFLVDEEKYKRGFKKSITALDELITAANNPNDAQGDAALRLALLYKKGDLVRADNQKYVEYLEKAVDAGNAEAAKLLGKAMLVGIVGDPDYSSARFYLEYAAANGIKGIEMQLERVNRAEAKEMALNSFSTPDDWYLDFLIAQSYSRTPTRNNGSSVPSTSFQSMYNSEPLAGSKMTTFSRTGNTIRGSNGTRYTVTGDTIRSSDGTRYTVTGDTIRGSDGSRYRMTGNSIRSSDGTRYRVTGSTIRGSDGTVCRTSRNRVRCY